MAEWEWFYPDFNYSQQQIDQQFFFFSLNVKTCKSLEHPPKHFTSTCRTKLKKTKIKKDVDIVQTAAISVTRFGDLLHFGELFKAFGNN